MRKFRLGRLVDPATFKLTERELLLDPEDLVTHAVIFGMTGSGKTGAAIVLLEEALLNGVPLIVIDPKGDATNIAIRVRQYQGEEVLPWLPADVARKMGMTPEEYAERVAEEWRKGLEKWNLDLSLAEKLAEVPIDVYTPGSRAGIPVSVLGDLNMPEGLSWEENEEVLREKIDGITSALLHLTGMNENPLAPPHVYLTKVFEWAWRSSVHLDFNALIAYILQPPFERVGALHVDMFMPAKERKKLAVSINSVVASSFFSYWLRGVPLDIDRLLWTKDGKPKAAVFYLAHLDEKWRMFAVTLILEAVYAWMFRTKSGGLKCIIYFDEVYGYLPPYPRNPPSKKPILLLLKQGRAFGVSVILSTQNPVDIDYKALSNAGIWMIGRLQTERDRERVLQGLEMAADQAGKAIPVRELGRLISSLGKRMFLIHNVHKGMPELFKTRWALTILRSPLTLEEVAKLVKSRRAWVEGREARTYLQSVLVPVPPKTKHLDQFFLPPREKVEGLTAYFPVFVVTVTVDMHRSKPLLDYSKTKIYFVIPAGEGGEVEILEEAYGLTPEDFGPNTLQSAWTPTIRFKPPPRSSLTKSFLKRVVTAVKKAVIAELTREVYYVPGTNIVSGIDEPLPKFLDRARPALEKVWREKAEKALASYKRKLERIESRLRMMEARIKQLKTDIKKLQIKAALEGKKTKRLMQTIESKGSRVRQLEAEKKVLEEERKSILKRIEEIKKSLPPLESLLKKSVVKPRRSEVGVEDIKLVWVPLLLDEETLIPAVNLYNGRKLKEK